jgi:hypothetical protein
MSKNALKDMTTEWGLSTLGFDVLLPAATAGEAEEEVEAGGVRGVRMVWRGVGSSAAWPALGAAGK